MKTRNVTAITLQCHCNNTQMTLLKKSFIFGGVGLFRDLVTNITQKSPPRARKVFSLLNFFNSNIQRNIIVKRIKAFKSTHSGIIRDFLKVSFECYCSDIVIFKNVIQKKEMRR